MRTFRLVFLFSLILAGAMAYATPAVIHAAGLPLLTVNPAKFGITQEGIYRVSANDLAAKFDLTNVNPAQLELTNLAAVDPNQQPTGQAVMGQPVPIFARAWQAGRARCFPASGSCPVLPVPQSSARSHARSSAGPWID